jgi:hypothetical protein
MPGLADHRNGLPAQAAAMAQKFSTRRGPVIKTGCAGM